MEQVITHLLQIFSSSTLQTHAELAIWGSNLLETPIALNKVSNQRNASVQVDTQRNLIFYKINKWIKVHESSAWATLSRPEWLVFIDAVQKPYYTSSYEANDTI